MKREDFERVIGSAPYERRTDRNPDDARTNAWPGQYRDRSVQLVFDVASDMTAPVEVRLREYQRALLWCYGWLNEAMGMKRPTPERIAGVIEDDKWNKVGALVGEASDEVEP